MPFTVEDLEDLLAILQQHPEWRARVLEALLGQEFLALPQQMQKLIEAQQRTDEQIAVLTAAVQSLVEAQRRTEERLEQLAEAQRRTEERLEQLAEEFAKYREQTDARLDRLERAVEALAEAQRRTEERLEQLAEAQRRTEERLEQLAEAQRRTEEAFAEYRRQTDARLDRLERGQVRLEVAFERLQREVRNLSNTIGMTVEDEAEDMVGWMLKKRGYAIRKSVQSAIIDGEVDVILLATAPDGQELTVVVEVKHRLGMKDVHRWAQRVQSKSYQRRLREAGYPPPYLPYLFTMRLDEPALDTSRALGIGLVNSRGEQVEGTLLISGGATR
jgi:myosin heavy subunit